MKVDLVEKTETSYITLVTETGSGPSTALANVADMLSIDWDSIEEVLCDEEDDDVSAVTEVKKLCTRDGQ
jgi:ABC-type phosphonate transport system ATPase subunit